MLIDNVALNLCSEAFTGWPIYKLEDNMVFDEFNIHVEKESDLKILDWERCYFLTKYFCL